MMNNISMILLQIKKICMFLEIKEQNTTIIALCFYSLQFVSNNNLNDIYKLQLDKLLTFMKVFSYVLQYHHNLIVFTF